MHSLARLIIRLEINMTRAEIEKEVELSIYNRLRQMEDFTPRDVADEEFNAATEGGLQSDTRRACLIVLHAQSFIDPSINDEYLEVGCGYGCLLFFLIKLIPAIRWATTEHPDRLYFHREDLLKAMRDHNGELSVAKITVEANPYPDHFSSVVTFSEILEHIRVERVSFLLSEIARVTRLDVILLMSSPNQASLVNCV